MLVAITSTGDLATKYLLPIANTLNSDSSSAPAPPMPPNDEFADPLPPPGRYKRVAAGHVPFLQSHVAREVTCPAIPRSAVQAQREKAFHPVCAPDERDCRFVFRTLGEQPACYQVDARPAVDGRLAHLAPQVVAQQRIGGQVGRGVRRNGQQRDPYGEGLHCGSSRPTARSNRARARMCSMTAAR